MNPRGASLRGAWLDEVETWSADLTDDQLDDLALISLLGPGVLIDLALEGPGAGVVRQAMALTDALAALGSTCEEATRLLLPPGSA